MKNESIKEEKLRLPNGVVLTPEAMEMLHQLQFNQGHFNYNGQKNQDIHLYKDWITNAQDSLAGTAHTFNRDELDNWRKTLLHIAELADIKRIIDLLSHPDF